MTAVALTPQASASVVLNITGAPAGPVVVTRTDANGTALVRQKVGEVVVAGALVLIDYEAALSGPVDYAVVDSNNVTTTASTTLAGVPGLPGLLVQGVQLPGLSIQPRALTGFNASREGGTTLHQPIGRDEPVPVLHPTRLRTGTLTMWAASFEEATGFERAIAAAALLLMRQVDQPGMDMYFVCRGISVDADERAAAGWRWAVRVDYAQTRSTSYPLLGAAGWTWADVVATYPTWAAVRATYPTWADLLVGP